MLTTKKSSPGAAGAVWVLWLILVVISGCTPPGPRALLDGERLILDGKADEAIVSLKKATELIPRNAQAWNHLGLAYHGAGKATEARKAYLQALSLNNDLAAARYNLGFLLLEQGDPAGAAREFATFTLLKPDNIDGWHQRGRAEYRARRTVDAVASLQRAVKLYPNQPETWNLIGLCELQRGRMHDAIVYFQEALKHQRNYAPALLNIGIATQFYAGSRNAESKPAALQYYREFLAAAPASQNHAAVAEAVRKLEAELAPPKATNTPPVLVAAAAPPTTPPPSAAMVSNTVNATVSPVVAPRVASVPTNATSPAQLTAVPAPAVPQVVSTPAKSTAEVTKVSIPATKPQSTPVAAVVVPAPAPVTRIEPTNPAAPTVSLPPASKTNLPPITNITSVPPQPEKRGFFERINPVNLFRDRQKPPTPLPSKSTTVKAAPAATPEPVRVMTPVLPKATEPQPSASTEPVRTATPTAAPAVQFVAIPRYAYLRPDMPASGDRERALQQVRSGAVLHQKRQFSEAAKLYREAVQIDPSLFEARYNLALVAYDSGALSEALSEGEMALVLNPTSSNARYNFALALESGGYFRDSALELERLLNLDPNSARAHLALANLYSQRLFDDSRARIHYLRVLQLDPANPRATDIRYWLAAHP